MKIAFTTTTEKSTKGVMTFEDDHDNSFTAIVEWTFAYAGSEVVITSIQINPQVGYQMPEYALIEDAYNFVRDQYSFVSFECKGNVTIQK